MYQEAARSRSNMISLSRIFTTTNTLMPNLYYENPRKLAIPRKGTDPTIAAYMTAAQNYYMDATNQKRENQEAIMNAWFFGLGWKKVGYHVATEPLVNNPENKLGPLEKMALGAKNILGLKPDQQEARDVPEYVRFETLVNTSESPCNILVDHKGDLMRHKVIAHQLPRTLHDLTTFGNYDKGAIDRYREMKQVERGTRFDDRNIELTLVEMTIEQRNGIWLLTFIEDFDRPLRYDKASHQGSMPFTPIMFTYEPGVRYPVSHMKVASNVQEWIDNVVNLQLEIIGKMRNQFYINRNLFDKGKSVDFEKNRIGGILEGNRPATNGDIAEISSKGVPPDMFNILGLFQQSATEILGSTEQRVSGKSKNDTFGQDKLAEMGGQIREGGLLDRVRDWLIAQSHKEGEMLRQFSNAQITLEISPRDYADPNIAQQVMARLVEFGTPLHPLSLRHYLQGQFDYRVNIYEAVKPNNPQRRREYMELMGLFAQPQVTQELLMQGKRIRMDKLSQEIAKTFEVIDAEGLIENLDPQQQAAIQATQVLQKTGGVVPSELGGMNQESEINELPQTQEAGSTA